MTREITKRDWRELARQGNLDDLQHEDIQGLTPADRAELIAELQQYVPKQTVGHGLEKREVYLHPRQLQGDAKKASASLSLFKLMREVEAEKHPIDRTFRKAIETAQSVLYEDLGVFRYEGLLSTYLHQLPDGRFEQIDVSGLPEGAKVGRPVINGKQRPATREELEWRYVQGEVYFWYGPDAIQTIAKFWRLGSFEINSPVDHAVSLLDAELRVRFLVSPYSEATNDNSNGKNVSWAIAENAFEMGRHFDALTKKPFEALAQQKLQHNEKNRANGPRGGLAKKAELRREVLNRLATADKHFCTKRSEGAAEVLMFIEKKQAIARAMKLTERYDNDRSPDDQLFSLRGRRLSKNWYDSWWDDFRSKQIKS